MFNASIEKLNSSIIGELIGICGGNENTQPKKKIQKKQASSAKIKSFANYTTLLNKSLSTLWNKIN